MKPETARAGEPGSVEGSESTASAESAGSANSEDNVVQPGAVRPETAAGGAGMDWLRTYRPPAGAWDEMIGASGAVRDVCARARAALGAAEDPVAAHRESGYAQRVAEERKSRQEITT